jgi:hypothetical protein
MSLVDHAARVKHDLGRYVAFQVRGLPPDAPLELRRDALAADLLATRKGPQGSEDAAELWARLRAGFGDRVDHPAIAVLDARMADVAAAITALRAGNADAAAVDAGITAALAVAAACKNLTQQLGGA